MSVCVFPSFIYFYFPLLFPLRSHGDSFFYVVSVFQCYFVYIFNLRVLFKTTNVIFFSFYPYVLCYLRTVCVFVRVCIYVFNFRLRVNRGDHCALRRVSEIREHVFFFVSFFLVCSMGKLLCSALLPAERVDG